MVKISVRQVEQKLGELAVMFRHCAEASGDEQVVDPGGTERSYQIGDPVFNHVVT
jgi:hypothetical protein